MQAETLKRDRPILFTPDNVRAILEGRKVQTRRRVADQGAAGERSTTI